MQNILHLHGTNVSEIIQALAEKRDEAPQFFLRSPVVVDCKAIQDECANIDFVALKKGLRAVSFVPIGIRHLADDSVQAATDAGWAILRDSSAKQIPLQEKKPSKESNKTADKQNSDTAEPVHTSASIGECVKVITRPIRSGQQVYAPEGDVVVLSQTGAGSEVLAAGSVHVYGKIAGRVLAGVNGDRSARIFCQGLDAELIAIAGNYQLLDEVDTPLKGKPAMISLEGDKLKIEPMV